MPRATGTPALAAVLAAALAAPAGAAPPPETLTSTGVLRPGVPLETVLQEPGDAVRLSDEQSVTRWTRALLRGRVRVRPEGHAPTVAPLRFAGANDAAEIYGVLDARLDAERRVWAHVRVPGRPNGRTGWALLERFETPHVTRDRLMVDRRRLTATLFHDDRRVLRVPVGVGTPATPTPRGHFFIVDRAGAIFGPTYGPHILFTNAYSSLPDWPGGGIVGLHGTNAPALVPGRPSHGCIRLHNADITRLYRRVRVGVPLRIR